MTRSKRTTTSSRKLPTAKTFDSNNDRLYPFFSGAALYNALKHPRAIVKETRDAFHFPYTERHIQCLWFDNSLRPVNLQTNTGEQVFVENPGRWNLEAGPDFLDAVLTIGPERRTLAGDIEIHITPRDWQAHAHASDKSYNRLIAHVSFYPGNIPGDSLPPGTIQISLRESLKMNPSFSFESIDLSAYPYSALPSRSTPCSKILRSWSPARLSAMLESAGEERLRIKALRFETGIAERGPDQLLYEEIMAALGYKHNSSAFRKLAAKLPLDLLNSETGNDTLCAYAIMLGLSGLLPAQTSQAWDRETKSFVRSLWDCWWKHQSRLEKHQMRKDDWRLSNLRPQNHPVRRLAAAASLFSNATGLAERVANINPSPETWRRKIRSLFQTAKPLAYWNNRLSFNGKTQKADVALVGADRIAAIESNVLIPFLASSGTGIRSLVKSLPPEQDNSLIRQCAFALFGRDQNPAMYHHGLRQQGLMQIFHDFCLNNRSACRECAFATAISSSES